ncbi:MAG TPA: hypothetical protein VFV77_01305, partial [Gammaproteobacteria bacterium]|nr:hypothetical protein [Gammaproteobacteria bacterium]
QAARYFSQGHEVNFLEIKAWLLMALATAGRRGREQFLRIFPNLLASPGIPSYLKVARNREVERLTTSD